MNFTIKPSGYSYMKDIIKTDSKGNEYSETITISNFVIIPKEIIKYKDTIEIRVMFQKETKCIEMLLDIQDFTSVKDFKKSINKIDATLKFIGNDNDLETIKCFVTEDESNICKYGVDYVGIVKHDGKWSYVDNTNNNKHVSVSKKVLNDNAFNEDPASYEDIKLLNECLFNFNIEEIVYSVLSGVTNCFINYRIRRIKCLKKKTPLVFFCGESGSGKTETTENVFVPFFGGYSCIKASIASAIKEFAILKQFTETNIFPIIIEEYKEHKMTKYRIDLISSIIRSLYDNHALHRGKPDLTYKNYQIIAPLLIVGETQIDEVAAKDRVLLVEFSRQYFDKKYEANMKKIKKLEDSITRLGRSLLNETLLITDEEIVETYNYLEEKLSNERMPDRVKNTIIMSALSYKLLFNVFKKNGVITKDVDGVFEIIKRSQKMFNLDGETKNKSVSESTLELIGRMIDNGNLIENDDYCIKDDMFCLRLSKTYDKVTKYLREFNIKSECYEKVSPFKKQIEKTDYFVTDKNVRNEWNGINSVKRCHLFSIKELSKLDMGFLRNNDDEEQYNDTNLPLLDTHSATKNMVSLTYVKVNRHFKVFDRVKGLFDLNTDDSEHIKGKIFLDKNDCPYYPEFVDELIRRVCLQNMKAFNLDIVERKNIYDQSKEYKDKKEQKNNTSAKC
jgi:hypothetical protein